MRIRILIALITLTFNSCNSQVKTYDFGTFEITGPSNWEVIEVQGIDSYVRMVRTESGDTLHFDYGYYSNSLAEDMPIVQLKKHINSLIYHGVDTSEIHFIDADTITREDIARFIKQQYSYDTIDGFKAKIVTPKTIGTGVTGIYFDSLGTGGVGNIRLNFLGVDLSEKDHNELLSALRTIKIK